MILRPTARLASLTTIALLLVGCGRSRPNTQVAPELKGPEMRKKYFYANRPYGTESQFNPMTSFLNNGYDQVRTFPDHRVFDFDYGQGTKAVWNSVVRVDHLVRQYGARTWLKYEVFPLSSKGEGGGQWVPNYQLHLFAGGTNYIRLISWFEQRDVPHPRVAAVTTFLAQHALNEIVENGAYTRGNIDATTDLLIFDPAALLFWNSDRVQRFFGSRLEFTEWPGQPSLDLPGRSVENTFETTMVRLRTRRFPNWRLFTTMGGSYVGGISHRGRDSTWWSLGAGADAINNPVLDTLTGRKTVELRGNVGLFLDKNGSLLGSILIQSALHAGAQSYTNGPPVTTGSLTVTNERCECARAAVNIYPGVVRIGTWSPGIWVEYLRSHAMRFGVTSKWGVGLGHNPH